MCVCVYRVDFNLCVCVTTPPPPPPAVASAVVAQTGQSTALALGLCHTDWPKYCGGSWIVSHRLAKHSEPSRFSPSWVRDSAGHKGEMTFVWTHSLVSPSCYRYLIESPSGGDYVIKISGSVHLRVTDFVSTKH